MSEKLKSFTLQQQLGEGYIRIPRIQRGYAQGRETKKVDNIRKTFLHTLFQVIKGNRESVELDFVYGSMKDGAFEPLDGQQRLTTLFLIHWMLGIDLRRKEDDRKSVFSYASCPTSEDFSNELVSHDSLFLVKEAVKKQTTPKELILKRDWFHRKWISDPSISSMLVMIDSIFKELTLDNDEWENDLDKYRRNLNNITFHGLNLGDFGLSNELFIKMNARGKQLSDFDKMKSTLEEEIQIQQSERDENDRAMASEEVEARWRTLMDGRWSDYFWHTFASRSIRESLGLPKEERKKVCLDAAKNCEQQFKRLLLRLIQLQLHSKMPTSESLREACYKMDINDIDDILLVYSDSLLSTRSREDYKVGNSETLIDFQTLMDTVDSILMEDENGIVKDIYGALSPDTHFIYGGNNLMEAFLSDNLPNDVALTFFASLRFIQAYPDNRDSEWTSNFSRWVKSFRNMLANYNNTQRIDKRIRYEAAMTAIMEITDDFVKFGHDSHLGPSDHNYVNLFFESIKNKTYQGIDNQALKEETDKAALILADSKWEEAIAAVDKDPYIWGQLRALIDWSGGDVEKFKAYSSKLIDLLGFINIECNRYYMAALKLSPNCWASSNRLYQLNFDRDNSFKRYLRDFDKDQSKNAPSIKDMLDLWIQTADELGAREFIDSVIAGCTYDSPAWIECIIKDPSILNFSNHKRLFMDKGHVVLPQYKTTDSHCIDPVLKYLHDLASKQHSVQRVVFEDSKGNNPHSLSFSNGESNYRINWSKEPGMYDMMGADGDTYMYSAEDLCNIVLSIINEK